MCFTWAWFFSLAVWIIIAVATWVILINILLPYLLRKIAPAGEIAEGINVVVAVLRVILWAVVALIVLYIVGSLLACLWSFAGGSLPNLFPHR